ncbi:MAG TPA: xanthine dehydrogenase family protein subunit M [Acidimicrobiia bacterium]|nr:xanthine dehydrogenase family protein subunit M [Acidimicrobiia bacterium]
MAISTDLPVSSFISPTTTGEALAALQELGSSATILAGGTDIMVQLQAGQIHPETILHIGNLDDLRGIDRTDTAVGLGSLVTHHQVGIDAYLSRRLRALAEACSTVGGWQTQEVGTLGGNVCNASPAADTIAPLLVADASVTLASTGGTRSMPLVDFILGRRSTAARPEELLTRLDVTPCEAGTGEVYVKVAPRTAMEVAVVGLAVRLSMTDGTVTDARIAATAVAPVPFRSSAAEQALIGSRLEVEAVEEASRLLAAEARPIDDARASASYRKMVLQRLVGRAVDTAKSRALEE